MTALSWLTSLASSVLTDFSCKHFTVFLASLRFFQKKKVRYGTTWKRQFFCRQMTVFLCFFALPMRGHPLQDWSRDLARDNRQGRQKCRFNATTFANGWGKSFRCCNARKKNHALGLFVFPSVSKSRQIPPHFHHPLATPLHPSYSHTHPLTLLTLSPAHQKTRHRC